MSLLLSLLAASGGAGTAPAPAAPVTRAVLKPGSNVVVDANSYYAKWVYDPIDQVGELKTYLDGAGVTHDNVAIPGQTWLDMILNQADLDGKFKPGVDNWLIIGEDRNAAWHKADQHKDWGPQQIADAVLADSLRYLATVKVKGWQVAVKYSSIPTDGNAGDMSTRINAALALLDAWWEKNHKGEGVLALARPRKVAPEYFDFDGLSFQGFMLQKATCIEANDGALYSDYQRVHPIGPARTAFAKAGAVALAEAFGSK